VLTGSASNPNRDLQTTEAEKTSEEKPTDGGHNNPQCNQTNPLHC